MEGERSFDDFGNFKAKLQQGEEGEEEEDDFEFNWDGCDVASEIPSVYQNGITLTLRDNQCAFKYQVINLNDNATYTFTVARDGAVALAASVALASTLAF